MIISKQDLSAFIGFDADEGDQDARLQAIADGVSAAVESYCNRRFEVPESDETEYVDGAGRNTITVRKIPIASFTSLSYVDPEDNETAIDASDYWRYDESGILKMKAGIFIEGSRNYKIVYKGGYAAADMPSDVRLACLKWGALLFKQADHNLQGATSVSIADKTTNYDFKSIPDDVAQLLKSWKLFNFG